MLKLIWLTVRPNMATSQHLHTIYSVLMCDEIGLCWRGDSVLTGLVRGKPANELVPWLCDKQTLYRMLYEVYQ